jgi:hypothetical protein
MDEEGEATVTWNGRVVAEQSIGLGAVIRFRTTDLRRGANDLVIEGPPYTRIGTINLEAE